MGTHGIDDETYESLDLLKSENFMLRFQIAVFKVTCRACGEEFASENSYSEANEMLAGHEEADHLA